MENTHDQHDQRIPLTAGFLSLPISDPERVPVPQTETAQNWFNIFVSEDSLCLEVVDWATYTYSAPVFLLEDATKRGYRLPTKAVKAVERFAVSGASVIAAMVDSIQTEMRAMARHEVTESHWLTQTEELIWLLVKAHVPDDIQLAVFVLLKPYRHYFDDDGRVVVKRRTP